MKIKTSLIIAMGLGFSHFSFGEVSPWLPLPGSLTITLSHVEQSADEFYFGDRKQSLPDDLDLSTTALNFTYGINDSFALDAKIGYAESDFDAVPDESLDGLIDSNIGITWQLVNEHASEKGWPSIAARLGVIIDGDYEAGAINSIGDGGDGAEFSIASGKVLSPYFAISSDFGVRDRSNDIPSEIFYGTSLYITPTSGLTTFVSYRVDDSRGDLQIGGNGFTANRFPEVEEDKEYVQLGAQYSVTESVSLGLLVARVIDGKNTSLSDVYAFNLSYNL